MSGKLKFNPQITQIKLNPEQAVLACSCWSGGRALSSTGTRAATTCISNTRNTSAAYRSTAASRSVS